MGISFGVFLLGLRLFFPIFILRSSSRYSYRQRESQICVLKNCERPIYLANGVPGSTGSTVELILPLEKERAFRKNNGGPRVEEHQVKIDL